MPVMRHLNVGGTTYDTVGEASVTQVLSSGTKIATVSIDGTSTDLYAPAGGGGGSTVAVTQSLSSGTLSAIISVNGSETNIYAPTPPVASSIVPNEDGTGNAGSSTNYARADHVHPTDTSRQAKLVSGTNIKTIGNQSLVGSGNVTVSSIGAATSSHSHGNITSGGDITATAPTIASGDCLVINDDSASKITNGPAFGSSTTTFLRNDGTWATPPSGGGGGSSWTDVSSVFMNTDPAFSGVAMTDGTLVYICGYYDSDASGTTTMLIPSSYGALTEYHGFAVDGASLESVFFYVFDHSAGDCIYFNENYSGTGFYFHTLYPLA